MCLGVQASGPEELEGGAADETVQTREHVGFLMEQ